MTAPVAIAALVNAAVLSVPLTSAVWLSLRLLPRQLCAAATRYMVWWAALLATVALPVVYLPSDVSAKPVSVKHVAATPIAPVGTTAHPDLPVLPASEPLVATGIPAAAATAHQFPISITTGPWTRWLLRAWAVTTLLMLARLILSCSALLRWKTASEPMEFRSPLSRNARLKVSSQVSAPMSVGFLRPAILLPVRFLDEFGAEELDQIVWHESAHLARRDDYALLVERAIEAVFALHPAVKFIARQMDLEREIACDDRVVELSGQPRSYAACLARAAEMSGRISFAAAGFAPAKSQLSRRVDVLLDKTCDTGTRLLKTRLACLAASLLAAAGMMIKAPELLAFSTPSPRAVAVLAAPVLAAPVSAAAAPASVPVIAPAVIAPERPRPAPPKLLAQAAAPAPIPPAPADQKPTMVMLPVEVLTQDGRSVAGLDRKYFRIFEDGVEQPLASFAVDDSPIAVEVIAADWRALKPSTLDALEAMEKLPGTTVVYVQPADGVNWGYAIDRARARLRGLPESRKMILWIGDASQQLQGLSYAPDITMVPTTEDELYPNPEAVLRRLTNPMSSYVLGYTPLRPVPDGSYRRTRVDVVNTQGLPPLTVKYRTGYYAAP